MLGFKLNHNRKSPNIQTAMANNYFCYTSSSFIAPADGWLYMLGDQFAFMRRRLGNMVAQISEQYLSLDAIIKWALSLYRVVIKPREVSCISLGISHKENGSNVCIYYVMGWFFKRISGNETKDSQWVVVIHLYNAIQTVNAVTTCTYSKRMTNAPRSHSVPPVQ